MKKDFPNWKVPTSGYSSNCAEYEVIFTRTTDGGNLPVIDSAHFGRLFRSIGQPKPI